MARRKGLSDAGVARLGSKAVRYSVPDPELRGHYIRVAATGAKSFVAVTRDPDGKQVWTTLGATDVLRIAEAREMARDAIKRVKAGLPAIEAPATKPDTFTDVAGNWMRRHVRANGLRSEGELDRMLRVYILPAWADRPFLSIRRSDVAQLLDRIQDERGARQADQILGTVRAICNWFAARHDDYIPPIARGMRRSDPKSRKRARILDDNELRWIWKTAEGNGTFGAFVRLALLTAQRRDRLAAMRWDDLSVDGEWRIPVEERAKGTGGALMLPEAAVAAIKAQPRLADNPYVFAGRGQGHFNGYSKSKRAFDAKLPEIAPWVIHDLRRTARSLMSRAGVRPDIAERVLGHVIAGVEGVYDRHDYRLEKADALKRLAALLGTIVDEARSPAPATVMP